jgi:diguanylate cyclase (GGDEF)-like protein
VFRASRIDRALGWVTWLTMAGGVGIDLAITGWTIHPDRLAVMVFCLVFFAILILRLVRTMRARTERRFVPGLLVIGIVLWAVESAVLQAGQHPGDRPHLALGELAFLSCYPVLALYLLLDVSRRATRASGTWLEATVICCGSASAAGLLLVTPLAAGHPSAVSLLVALVYPVLDVMLGLLVLGQIALGVRERNRDSALLVLGFVLLAIADFSFVGQVIEGSQGSTVLNVVMWGAGFACIVSVACRTRVEQGPSATGELPTVVLIGSALAAMAVLIVHPDDAVGAYLTVPAVTTLLAAGARLGLALREVRGAAAAIELSQTDDLTQLPNRRALLTRLDRDLTDGRPAALMLMDLDGFKDINDTLGHASGDVILQMCGRRMRAALGPDVLIARLGGDEFALVAPTDDEIELIETANQALEALRRPAVIDGIELVVEASVGIALQADGEHDSSDLLRRADIAMYQAKSSGSGPLLYDPTRDEFSRHRLRITEELRRGIAEGQLIVWYQPQIDAATQRVVGLEALVRWQHPTSGLLGPAAFLPAARHAGLMPMLSEAVIEQTVRDLRGWRDVGIDVRVALNCAPPELLSGIFVRQLLDALAGAGLTADDALLEVTEDSFLADPERARQVLTEVRDRGLQISVDDYGTGFSSLTYLRELPVDELKMDRSFVSTVDVDRRSRMIVESTVKLAHALDLRIVVEGVEDAATSAVVVAMGADVIQGYHVSKPMPPDEVEPWLTAWTLGLIDVASLDRRRNAG